MLDRLSWFVTGVVAGGVITVRALRRRPRPRDVKSAALATGADLLDLAAHVIQPPRRHRSPRWGDRPAALGRARGAGEPDEPRQP